LIVFSEEVEEVEGLEKGGLMLYALVVMMLGRCGVWDDEE
jgi:hypothetical protein